MGHMTHIKIDAQKHASWAVLCPNYPNVEQWSFTFYPREQAMICLLKLVKSIPEWLANISYDSVDYRKKKKLYGAVMRL